MREIETEGRKEQMKRKRETEARERKKSALNVAAIETRAILL